MSALKTCVVCGSLLMSHSLEMLRVCAALKRTGVSFDEYERRKTLERATLERDLSEKPATRPAGESGPDEG